MEGVLRTLPSTVLTTIHIYTPDAIVVAVGAAAEGRERGAPVGARWELIY
jgi:hypothetical protein